MVGGDTLAAGNTRDTAAGIAQDTAAGTVLDTAEDTAAAGERTDTGVRVLG